MAHRRGVDRRQGRRDLHVLIDGPVYRRLWAWYHERERERAIRGEESRGFGADISDLLDSCLPPDVALHSSHSDEDANGGEEDSASGAASRGNGTGAAPSTAQVN